MNENLESRLVARFNNREPEAFGEVYDLLYKGLYCYTENLFKDSVITPEDIIHDAFITLFDNNAIFVSMKQIRGYIYIYIKNRFLMDYRHQNVVNRVNSELLKNEDYFIVQAAEAEVYSFTSELLKLLPNDCIESFKLYLEGFDIKEIATMLNKSESAIYKQRSKSINEIKTFFKRGMNKKLF